MSHADNKVEWCLKKAEKEVKDTGKHRGLLKIEPDIELANEHILKAEHDLKAITDFDKTGYSDWSASAAFYSIYHSLLAILAKFGYESGNQECTFALIYQLIDKKELDISKELIQEVYSMEPKDIHEKPTVIESREAEQYGTKRSMEKDSMEHCLDIAKQILSKAKDIIHG